MKQKIVDEALGKIRKRREEAEFEARKKLLTALEIPEFKEAYENYTAAKIEEARNQAFGKKSTSNFEKHKHDLFALIKKHSLSGIFPTYNCPACKDKGIENGMYCQCLKKEIAAILMSQSGFDNLEKFENANFEIFEDKQKTKKIYDKMQEWCNKNSEKGTIFICGHAGTGKTHLTKCMASELISKGAITQIMTAFSLNQKFLAIHTAKEEDKTALIDELKSIEALFIDDLGTEPVYRNVTREYLYLLINERQSRGLKTVITSNLYPEDVRARYDERIFSRLMDKNKSIVIEMSGKDLRIGK